jgi:hypothetical protein
MRLNAMSALWARTAMLWFLVTIGFGLFMGTTQQFNFAPAHAHMGVLGWLSSGVFALIHALGREWPETAKLPRAHWIGHNLGVAVMTGSLAMELRAGDGTYAPFIAVGAVIVVLSAIAFVAMTWGRLAPQRAATVPASGAAVAAE